jgi:hypothetical protein
MIFSAKKLWPAYAFAAIVLLMPSMKAHTQEKIVAKSANFCDVVSSPGGYSGKLLEIEASILASEHDLFLYQRACESDRNHDVTTEAVLPEQWLQLPNGRKLSAYLRRHRPAKVHLIGTFESSGGPFGPEGCHFRFSVSEITAVYRQ